MNIFPNKNAYPIATHEPFSWLCDSLTNNTQAEFLALTKTITRGVATCLEIVQKSNMDRDSGTAPTLSINDTESLLMLAIESLKLLEKSAEEDISSINDHAMKEATK